MFNLFKKKPQELSITNQVIKIVLSVEKLIKSNMLTVSAKEGVVKVNTILIAEYKGNRKLNMLKNIYVYMCSKAGEHKFDPPKEIKVYEMESNKLLYVYNTERESIEN